ncbi:MAG: hypothetical protein WDW38_006541 [Sanguina aurantia]
MNHRAEILTACATIRAMLVDRVTPGCVEDLDALSPDDIVAAAGNLSVFHIDLPRCRHRILFDLAVRFKLVEVRKSLETQEADIDVILLVVFNKPTTAAHKSIGELKRDIQIFTLGELQYNVTQHVLVPLHRAIRDEAEIRELLRRFQLPDRYKMPLIPSTDPVARYLALKPGQVVHITRASPSCGVYVNYRCCMK